MVLDSLDNLPVYVGLHPRFRQAFDYIKSTDFSKFETGKIEIDGDRLFVVVADVEAKSPEQTKVETHNRYIDIQIPLTGTETMGFIVPGLLKSETAPYSEENDITFYEEKATSFLNVNPGEFVIFFPQEGHQPGLGHGNFRKLIVKVLF
ncbi:MAG: YhcH/YjgK/YiaL family protein [Bacteroidales bacterium]